MSNECLDKIRECVDELFLLEQKAEAREQKLSQEYESTIRNLNDLISITKQQLENIGHCTEKLEQDLKLSQKRVRWSIKMVVAALIIMLICFAVIFMR